MWLWLTYIIPYLGVDVKLVGRIKSKTRLPRAYSPDLIKMRVRRGKRYFMYILAIKRSKGNFQGNDYDNIVFTCVSEDVPKSLLAGTPLESLKVKSDTVVDILGKSISSIDWDKLLGAEILPVYNKYAQVSSFSISLDDNSASIEMAAESVPDIDSDTSLDCKGKKK